MTENQEIETIKVIVRVRPLNSKEILEGAQSCLSINQNVDLFSKSISMSLEEQ